jgi:hypothetical protein
MAYANLTFILLCFLLLVSPVHAAEESQKMPSCKNAPEFRQFDFWIGEWDVFVNDKQAGSSSIQLILDDCVIFENYTGQKGYAGKSFNVFDKSSRKWRQFWIDNAGDLLTFEGEYKNGKLSFTGESLDSSGTKLLHRLTFFDLPEKAVRQFWEQSKDGGKTWTPVFDGLYRRKRA